MFKDARPLILVIIKWNKKNYIKEKSQVQILGIVGIKAWNFKKWITASIIL